MTATAPPEFRYLERAEQLIRALPADTQFTNADIYARMRTAGWPDMQEPRRFGPLLQRLRADGVIVRVGVDASPARSHGGFATVWRRVEAA
ncbi:MULTISPECIES: hypothetical protein [Nocardia]|uniref:hypothetical protein n=1 Tax=Nocardia TaxID=1817 RepID=UPI000D68871B|nr:MULTISPECIES: hypothetical protein [Nocardia]